jgi:hypothetical protein
VVEDFCTSKIYTHPVRLLAATGTRGHLPGVCVRHTDTDTRTVSVCSAHSINGPSGTVEGKKFIHQFTYYQLLKEFNDVLTRGKTNLHVQRLPEIVSGAILLIPPHTRARVTWQSAHGQGTQSSEGCNLARNTTTKCSVCTGCLPFYSSLWFFHSPFPCSFPLSCR